MGKIRILLVDDHRVVLEGLRVLLDATDEFEVIGEARDGFEAVTLVGNLRPDVVVMDLMMPNLGGLEALNQIRQKWASVKVIILSMHESEAYILRAVNRGAAGYVLKDSSSVELVDAIHCVVRGDQYYSASIADKVSEMNKRDYHDLGDAPLDFLTRREREIFQMVAEGYSSTVIAEKLGISSRTVESHRGNFMRKLGLRSQTDVIRMAIRQGVISLDE